MKNTYTIPEIERENVTKILNRYGRKADVYGKAFSYEMGDPYAKEVAVWVEDIDPITGTTHTKKIADQMVEAFDLTIDCEIVCKDGYSVVAKLEHLENANIVYTIGDDQVSKPEWGTMKAKCEHCGGNHGQKVTFIVRNESGEEIQVGRTCLKDYCGIDPQHIGMLNQLHDIFIKMEPDCYDFSRCSGAAHAYNTMDVLALAIRIQKLFGYISSSEVGSNKSKLASLIKDHEVPTVSELSEAQEMAKVILSFDSQTEAYDYRLDNVYALLKSGYCKFSHFGYMAYAPLAFERYQERAKKQAAYDAKMEAERSASNYIGEVGKRLVLDVSEIKLITSWLGDFGYTYLYKITDPSGNVMIWRASKKIENTSKIKATIREHSEYNGVKQTVITRCVAVKTD